MMNEEDLSSDSSDEDYVPRENEALSEEEDSGDEEDFPVNEVDCDKTAGKKSKGKKRATKNQSAIVPRKRRGGISLAADDAPSGADAPSPPTAAGEDPAAAAEQSALEGKAKQEAETKAKADLLWADFMKDVSSKPKPKAVASAASESDAKPATALVTSVNVKVAPPGESSSSLKKVVVVKEFKFAGETVTMSSTVDANSREAKQELGKGKAPASTQASAASPFGQKRPGGLGAVLGKIDPRPKMSTLVKSKLDWEGFKSAEGIDDDLKIHNRGKEGFLERQAFLERTDHRQFEIERSLRLGSKRK